MIIYTSMTPDDIIAARYKELQDMLAGRKSLLTSLHHDTQIVRIQISEIESVIVIYDRWMEAQNGIHTTAGGQSK